MRLVTIVCVLVMAVSACTDGGNQESAASAGGSAASAVPDEEAVPAQQQAYPSPQQHTYSETPPQAYPAQPQAEPVRTQATLEGRYPPYPGYEPQAELMSVLGSGDDVATAAGALVWRNSALFDSEDGPLAAAGFPTFRLLDMSGDLPTHIAPGSEEESSRLIGKVDDIGGAVAVDGDHALVAGTNFYGESTFWVVDISTPSAPQIVGSLPLTPLGAHSRGSVVADDGLAYVMLSDQSLVVIDVGDPTAPQEIGRFTLPFSRSPIHKVGDTVLVYGDYVDVTDPSAPRSVKDDATPWPHLMHSAPWALEGGRAYVPYRGSVLVLDVSDPLNMTPVGVVELESRVHAVYSDGEHVVAAHSMPQDVADGVVDYTVMKPQD